MLAFYFVTQNWWTLKTQKLKSVWTIFMCRNIGGSRFWDATTTSTSSAGFRPGLTMKWCKEDWVCVWTARLLRKIQTCLGRSMRVTDRRSGSGASRPTRAVGSRSELWASSSKARSTPRSYICLIKISDPTFKHYLCSLSALFDAVEL